MSGGNRCAVPPRRWGARSCRIAHLALFAFGAVIIVGTLLGKW